MRNNYYKCQEHSQLWLLKPMKLTISLSLEGRLFQRSMKFDGCHIQESVVDSPLCNSLDISENSMLLPAAWMVKKVSWLEKWYKNQQNLQLKMWKLLDKVFSCYIDIVDMIMLYRSGQPFQSSLAFLNASGATANKSNFRITEWRKIFDSKFWKLKRNRHIGFTVFSEYWIERN